MRSADDMADEPETEVQKASLSAEVDGDALPKEANECSQTSSVCGMEESTSDDVLFELVQQLLKECDALITCGAAGVELSWTQLVQRLEKSLLRAQQMQDLSLRKQVGLFCLRALQLAYMRTDEPAKALVQADRSRLRAQELELLLTLNLKQCDALPAAALPSIDDFRDFASRHRAALVMYSQLTDSKLVAWVLNSTGGPLACKEIDVPQEEGSLIELLSSRAAHSVRLNGMHAEAVML